MYRISVNGENAENKVKRAQEAGKIVDLTFIACCPDPCYVIFDNEQEMQAETAKWAKLGLIPDNIQDDLFNDLTR